MRYEEMSLRQKIGQMIVTGFPEESMSREFINLVEEYKVGNVILFQYNQKSRIQLKALCKELKKMIESSWRNRTGKKGSKDYWKGIKRSRN